MSERANRFILGFCLISFLFLEWNYGVIAIILVLFFEAITSWRISTLISRIRHTREGAAFHSGTAANYKFNYEAELMTRLTVAINICLGFIMYPEALWFLPYFVGLNLLLSGVTGLCPLVMFFKKVGFS